LKEDAKLCAKYKEENKKLKEQL